MKKCKYCQAEIPEDGSFCPKCGKEYTEEETTLETAANEEAVSTEQTAPAEEPVPADEPVSAQETAPAEEAAPAEETVPTEEAASTEEPAPTEEAAPAAEESQHVTEIKAGLQATPGRIALAVAAVVVLLAVLIALIVTGLGGEKEETIPETTAGEAQLEADATEVPATVPADGNPDDVTCKGSYTVTDEEAIANKDTVVATVGDAQLTNSQLQVYYWMEVQGFLSNYGAYAYYFGMDYTQPLDTQLSMEGNMTWQQYFLQCALDNWHQIQAMMAEAEKEGLEMGQEDRDYLDGLEASLEENAAYYGLTLDELLLYNIGPGAEFDDYAQYEENYLLGVPYYEAEIAKMVPTDQDLEDFFAEHESEYNDNGITKDGKFVDVRHILIGVDGGTTDEDGNITYSDEEWAACEEEAQAVLDAWLAGEKTEDSFAALAGEKSEDPGSSTNGGLYENVYEGQMVQAFNDWCFDESRVPGDYGLVQTEFGYHVMYFTGSKPQWKYYAESDWVNEQTNQMFTNLMDNYPMEVDYSKIALGYIALG